MLFQKLRGTLQPDGIYIYNEEGNVTGQEPFSSSKIVSNQLDVLCNYDIITNLNLDGGRIVSGDPIIKLETNGTLDYTKLPVVEREGYTFIGWTDDKNVGLRAGQVYVEVPSIKCKWLSNDIYNKSKPILSGFTLKTTQNQTTKYKNYYFGHSAYNHTYYSDYTSLRTCSMKDGSVLEIFAVPSEEAVYWWTETQYLVLPQNCRGLFSLYRYCDTIDLTNLLFNEVTVVQKMFASCRADNLDLRSTNLGMAGNLDARNMFYQNKLTSTNVYWPITFTPANVYSVYNYCYGGKKIVTLPPGTFSTRKR